MGSSLNKFFKIREIVEKINKENAIILVEGIKDKIALEKIGITLPILDVGKTKLEVIIEKLSIYDLKIIILFDIDKKGEELTRKTIYLCQLYGIKYDTKYRKLIKRELNISRIEDLRNL